MTASPNEQSKTTRETHLSLVHASEEPLVTSFDARKYDEGAIARRIGPLTTYASEHYREFLGGKSGVILEVEHRNKRRALAVRIFQKFGMLEGALRSDEELAKVLAAKKAAYKTSKTEKDREANTATATDVLSDTGRAFIEQYYDPAERAVETRPKSELSGVIEAYFDHPVIKTTNSWARQIGESDDNMLKDAILLQRASAIILEHIGEPRADEDL
jgi:hypothetical protein